MCQKFIYRNINTWILESIQYRHTIHSHMYNYFPLLLSRIRNSCQIVMLCYVADKPVITARVGTFKRKQEVRQFLENMPRDNVDDIFSCSYMKNKRFEVCFSVFVYLHTVQDPHVRLRDCLTIFCTCLSGLRCPQPILQA